MAVGHVREVLAVALHIVRGSKSRNDRVGIDTDDAARRLAANALVADTEIYRPMRIESPVISRVERVVVDVQHCATDRQPVLDLRFAGHE